MVSNTEKAEAEKAEAKKGKVKEPDLLSDTPSCFVDTHGVIVSTMNQLPGYRIVKVFGTVYGITVRSRNWGTEIGAFLKSAVGGEIRYFTNLMYSSRNAAMERLVGECLARGGNAIIAMRFDQGEIQTYSQVCAYGTACLVETYAEMGKHQFMT